MNAPVTNRNHKDTVFRLLFSGKKELLELYNAVNGTHYTREEDLEYRLLENALYMGMKNDISFILYDQLHLYEHQSSVNPNIPLRDLVYTADLLKGMLAKENIYGSRKIRIPEPRFVVFYNGKAKLKEAEVYRLSDLYERPTDDPDLDLRVRVLNINLGYNQGIVNASETLKGYTVLINKIREKQCIMDAREAVDAAVRECIEDGILKDFLEKHRAEVISMWLYEYDAEQQRVFDREEGIEIGIERERVNTERERAKAERERMRAEKAEAEVKILKGRLDELKGLNGDVVL